MTPEAVVNRIRRRYADRLFCVASLAAELKVSESHLREMVNRHFKCSPHCLIETIRLENAVVLIGDNLSKVYSVCSEVGYANVKTFRIAFKKRTGMTPQECKIALIKSRNIQADIDRIIRNLWNFTGLITGEKYR